MTQGTVGMVLSIAGGKNSSEVFNAEISERHSLNDYFEELRKTRLLKPLDELTVDNLLTLHEGLFLPDSVIACACGLHFEDKRKVQYRRKKFGILHQYGMSCSVTEDDILDCFRV